MKIKISKLETILDYEIKTNFTSIGFDTAIRTGVCIIKTTKENVEFDWYFLEFAKKKSKERYIRMGKEFADTLESENVDCCIIEDTHLKYFGKFAQVQTLKTLTRFGGLILANAINNDIPFEIIGASPARSKFHIDTKGYGVGNSKKAVAEWLKNNLKIELDDEDISDAIILALLGICEGVDFSVKKKKRKRK